MAENLLPNYCGTVFWDTVPLKFLQLFLLPRKAVGDEGSRKVTFGRGFGTKCYVKILPNYLELCSGTKPKHLLPYIYNFLKKKFFVQVTLGKEGNKRN